ncbi:MAG: coproporphyrinogen-III oxidase family protein [Candidatus Moraniibacteriota bacterium]
MRKNNWLKQSESRTDIYFHVPFCVKKCAYCYFYSLENQDALSVDTYLGYLEKEIILKKERWDFPDRIGAVYIGGGTPSYLSPAALARLFALLRTHFDIRPDTEFTMEVNPTVCDREKLDILKKNGVNRLSFGIQTVDEELLRTVGRAFDRRVAVENIRYAKQLGFKTINLDFMYGLPGQTLDDVTGDIGFIRDMDPSSVYWYETKNVTEYMKAVNQEHADPMAFDALIRERMKALGYHRTMTEFFSKDDIPCRYTFDFLLSDHVVSFGPFAISKYGNAFFKNVSDLRNYYDFLDSGELPIVRTFELDAIEAAASFLAYQLRFGSADLEYIGRKFGVNLSAELGTEVGLLVKYGFLKQNGPVLSLTHAGLTHTPDVQIVLLNRHKRFLKNLNVFLGRGYGLR